MVQDLVSRPWHLEEIIWNLHWQLPLLSPLPYGVEILADMFGVEVHECFRLFLVLWLPPHLSKHSDINLAHQLLANDIKTVCCNDY